MLVRHSSAKRAFANRLLYSCCELFQDPYRVSPVFATLAKIPGCIPTLPISELAGKLHPPFAKPLRTQRLCVIPFFPPPHLQPSTVNRRSRPVRGLRPLSSLRTYFIASSHPFSPPFTLCVHSCTVFLHILAENGMVRAAYHVLHTGHLRFQHRRSPEITWN